MPSCKLLTLITALLFLAFNKKISAQLNVNSSVSPSQMVSALIGQGATVSNVSINCVTGAYGTFTSSGTNLGINNGILLTTGSATGAIGPNNTTSSVDNWYYGPDGDLATIEPLATNDPCIFEFDIVPQCNSLQIRFVFGSEEYPEFVNASYNDAFGFFISGPNPSGGSYWSYNIARLPNGTPVSIDNVNNLSNSAYFVDNSVGTWVQYDGFTTVVTSNVALVPCQTYHFKMAIADANDYILDSGVFIDYLQCSNVISVATSSTAATCSNCNGTATASVSNNLSGVSYSWSPSGGNSSTASNLCPGTYTVTIDDAYSCIPAVSQSVVVGATGSMSSSISAQNVSCPGGSNGSATVTIGTGTAPYSFSWSNGQTTQTAVNLAAGTYTCTVTDAAGCQNVQTISVTQPSALSASNSQTNVSCAGGSNGSASAFVSGGNGGYAYSWSPYGGGGSTASGLSAGTFTCTITDAAGCQTTTTVNISQPSALSASSTSSPTSCAGGSNGSATASVNGGTAGYTFSWSNGQSGATVSNLSAGNYTCTITDALGCQTSTSVTVSQPSALSASTTSTSTTCFGGSNGSASVSASGGTNTFSYNWSPSGQSTATAVNLSAGTYTVTITDGNGCQASSSATVSQASQVTGSATSTNALCPGQASGSASANGAGGNGNYNYSWSPGGATGQSVSGLLAGTYTITITDGLGCTGSTSVSVGEPPVISSTTSSTNASCGMNDGSASVSISGGTPPYNCLWSPTGAPGQNLTNVAPGAYSVTITDQNGCQSSANVTVNSDNAASVSVASVTDVTCNGQSTGSATLSVTGGTPGYSYSWAPVGGSSSSASSLPAGSYTVTVTDAGGCVSSTSFNISEPSAITSTTSFTPAGCINDGTASVTSSGGSGNHTYLWDNGANTSSITGLASGQYCVTVTDGVGCTNNTCVTVTQNSGVTVSANGTSQICIGETAILTAGGSGGTPGYSYSWLPGALSGSTVSVTPGITTTYTVTATDVTGCSSPPQQITVTVNPPLAVLASGDNLICVGDSVTISTLVTGGDGNYSYIWNIGGNTSSVITDSPLNSTSYVVTVSDGCGTPSTTDTIVVTVNSLPQPSISVNSNSGCEPHLAVFADQTSSACVSQTWDFGDGTVSTTNNPSHQYNTPGIYSVSMICTDNNGCSDTVQINNMITVHVVPTAAFIMTPSDSATLPVEVCVGDNSLNADSISWILDGASAGNTSTLCIEPATPGNYCVQQLVTTQNGCIDTTTECIVVLEESFIIIPNVFTPNGDGQNDYFHFKNKGLKALKCEIYDRWGVKMIELDNVKSSWDGFTMSGTPAAPGVYYFMLRYQTDSGMYKDYQGFVELIRK